VEQKTNKKWGILNYLSTDFYFFWKDKKYFGPKDMWNGILGQKLGYDNLTIVSQHSLGFNV